MDNQSKYSLSYVAGAMLYEETKVYMESIKDFEAYLNKEEEVDYMVIPTNSESSKKRLKSEIDKRLRNLNKTYLESFNSLQTKDQQILLFLAICKTYDIITEFVIEEVYQKWKRFDNELTTYDFEYFLSTKLDEEQLNAITDKTKYKAAQVALRILKDIGILDEDKINQIFPSEVLQGIISTEGDNWFFNCLLIG